MSLEPGTTLGSYQVTAKIGEGGMGEGWQATDTKLNRQVALKILPDAFADDPDRLARFQREAQVLASLNHPNIAAIYGIEQSDDTQALVLELVEGPTLADRIAQGSIPLDEALPIAKQIAEALEAAHEAGVIHRDLKPANIKVREDGTVKVLDFGLAKALDTAPEADPSESPTLTAIATRPGIILGTAAYMSPEQAKGRAVDKRTDVWAFGAVLYEMLSGQPLFQRSTVPDALAALLRDDPDFTRVPPQTPAQIKRLLRRCLARDSRNRVRDIGDARLELEEAVDGRGEERVGSAERSDGPTEPVRSTRTVSKIVLAATVVLVFLGVSIGWFAFSDGPAEVPVRFSMVGPAEITGASVSPNGRLLVLEMDDALWLRTVDSLETRRIEESTEAGVPFWSPDSMQLAFFVANRLRVASVDGGPTQELPYEGIWDRGGTWAADGIIVAENIDRGGLVLLPFDGGEPRLVAGPPGLGLLRFPLLLPDGATLIYNFALSSGAFSFGQMYVQSSLDPGVEPELLVDLPGEVFGYAAYAQNLGLLLLPSTQSGIWALPLSDADYRPTEPPRLLLPDAMGPSSSADGMLVYGAFPSGGASASAWAWVGRNGTIIETIPHEFPNPRALSLSPDGTRVAFASPRAIGMAFDLWVFDLVRRGGTLLTPEPGAGIGVDWLDDRAVVYVGVPDDAGDIVYADQGGEGRRILAQPAGGGGESVQLAGPSNLMTPSASGEGGPVVFAERHPSTGLDIYYVEVPGDEPRAYLASATDEYSPRLSPNGTRIIYISEATGSRELWISTFPEAGEPIRLSFEGAGYSRWSPPGDEIFFDDTSGGSVRGVEAGTLWVVAVDRDVAHGRDAYSRPERLFAATDVPTVFNVFGSRNWDVGADGQRILTVPDSGGDSHWVMLDNFPRWYRER